MKNSLKNQFTCIFHSLKSNDFCFANTNSIIHNLEKEQNEREKKTVGNNSIAYTIIRHAIFHETHVLFRVTS